MNFSIKFPENLIFGLNSLENLGEYVEELGNSCIIVTGKSSVKKSGALDIALNSLEKHKLDYIIFDKVRDEPNTLLVDELIALCKNQEINFIIGLGGGSVLDVAKAAAGLYGQKGSTLDYLNKEPFDYKGIAFVAIPTTSGTGSEITLNSVLYNEATKNKTSMAHNKFQARLSIIDPSLTYSMPPSITAATGMDALTHAIESYTSKEANPITTVLAGEAIRLIGSNIIPAINNGEDSIARNNMALGSVIAALAFAQTGVGVCHAISHPLGAIFNIPHGVANAILLPNVIDFNNKVCSKEYNEIQKLLGGRDKVSSQIRELLSLMPIPKSLKETEYKGGYEQAIVRKTFHSRSLIKNPRKVREKDILEIIEKSL